MSRTIKRQPKREKPRKLKQDDVRKPFLKRSNLYDFAEDDLEE
jgi:hypothetical protein